MPSNRHNLILDEQAFQGLLSAAFIVQEYNDRLSNDRPSNDRPSNGRLSNDGLNGNRPKQARPGQTEPEASLAPESPIVCRHCGAPKPTEESRCESCRRNELRPGERLQRNWASMWLMSQEQDLWPRRSFEICDPAAGTSAHDKSVIDKSKFGAPSFDAPASGAPSFDAPASKAPALDKPTFHTPVLDDQALGNPASDAQALNQAEAESKSATAAIDEAMDEATGHWTQDGEDSAPAVHTFQLSASDDSLPIEASPDESAELSDSDAIGATDPGGGSLLQHFADLRGTLRLHRSNLYLGGAVLVAALALLWPAVGSPQRPALSPWERALVTLGLADAPEPAVHVQGDPAIEVWVDPHTALYYCPGEEQYGKTADGRLSSQREAQMDRFEPAGRSACE
jgi:ribosomal protein L40E